MGSNILFVKGEDAMEKAIDTLTEIIDDPEGKQDIDDVIQEIEMIY